jgi:hypothetical protein
VLGVDRGFFYTNVYICFFSLILVGGYMPQITCPNCGMTINLENRKEIDYDMIKSAIEKEPRTFTDLLHLTKLSRKTLSLRLNALRGNGTVCKEEGKYRINGAFQFDNNGGHFARGLFKIGHDRRVRAGIVLIAFLLFSSASSYVLANYILSSEKHEEPQPIGKFSMTLSINNIEDLYAWQVVISFNSSEIKTLDMRPGDFLGTSFPSFTNSTNSGDGILLLLQFLSGDDPGKSGSGTLATIVFGYFVNNYKEPMIVAKYSQFETMLWKSTDLFNPIKDPGPSVLTLSPT